MLGLGADQAGNLGLCLSRGVQALWGCGAGGCRCSLAEQPALMGALGGHGWVGALGGSGGEPGAGGSASAGRGFQCRLVWCKIRWLCNGCFIVMVLN